MSTTIIPRSKPVNGLWRAVRSSVNLVGSSVLILVCWILWVATAQPVQVTVDGVTETIYTHRHTVRALLPDLGLVLKPSDRLTTPLATPLKAGLKIVINRAWPVRILADGRDVQTASWGNTPRQVLQEANIAIDNYDQVVVDDHPLGLDQLLPEHVPTQWPTTYRRGYGWQRWREQPFQLRVHRALPITVEEDGLPFPIRTTAQTVGEALRQADITLYLGDLVQPNLGSRVNTGLRVYIQRSTPINLRMDNRVIKTRIRAKTVGDALTATGVGIAGLDQVTPTLATKLYPDIKITITRVRDDVEVKEEITPFETVFGPKADMPIDTQEVTTSGAEGITRHRFRVRYEDGKEVKRILEDTWVAQEPVQQVISYGQQIAPATFTAPDGTQVTYWRKIRMYATSYSASTAGVSKDSAYYGRTFTGEQMRNGIVAVDASIVPLRSRVYVPDYGYGDALDTGGAIHSRRIDLGYDDASIVSWSRWVDVYLLWPPPPEYQITWVLPNWPRLPD
ncbi:MAG: ubiquitin-like domain-containing protein [Chloroflexi bacterium]|nr:ubiquitin-like domain-containing protein [Chloroflexota bacterium]